MFTKTLLLLPLALLIATACATPLQTSRMVSPIVRARRECKRQKSLICNLTPVSGSSISGKVVFTPAFRVAEGSTSCRVRIRAIVAGLTGRWHGFHIHMYGDTSALDGTSTGPHFANPQDTPAMHGHPDDDDRHWGDFGNLRNRDGIAKYNRVDSVITLQGILGRGITIHEGRDMGADEQPSGAAGPRKAVCVIGFANPSSLAGFVRAGLPSMA